MYSKTDHSSPSGHSRPFTPTVPILPPPVPTTSMSPMNQFPTWPHSDHLERSLLIFTHSKGNEINLYTIEPGYILLPRTAKEKAARPQAKTNTSKIAPLDSFQPVSTNFSHKGPSEWRDRPVKGRLYFSGDIWGFVQALFSARSMLFGRPHPSPPPPNSTGL